MIIDALRAAKYLGKVSNWKLTSYEMQKIIYLANMVYLGEKDDLLIEGSFQAFERGPVHPDLYEKLIRCGDMAVNKNVLVDQEDLIEAIHEEEIKILNRMFKIFPPGSEEKLYKITHWEKGAWHKTYKEGKNIPIRKGDILEEYKTRLNTSI